MSPRKEFPDDEPDILLGKRDVQRMRREELRRVRGKPEPSVLAGEISRALWLYRQIHWLTQQELGDVLDMKQSQIARLESGFVEPGLETLSRISERLGIDITIEVRSGVVKVEPIRPGSRRA